VEDGIKRKEEQISKKGGQIPREKTPGQKFMGMALNAPEIAEIGQGWESYRYDYGSHP